MKTVNSLSGGKTSSYIAVHYPADIEIFALCCIDCHNAGKNIDKQMKQRVNDKYRPVVIKSQNRIHQVGLQRVQRYR